MYTYVYRASAEKQISMPCRWLQGLKALHCTPNPSGCTQRVHLGVQYAAGQCMRAIWYSRMLPGLFPEGCTE